MGYRPSPALVADGSVAERPLKPDLFEGRAGEGLDLALRPGHGQSEAAPVGGGSDPEGLKPR